MTPALALLALFFLAKPSGNAATTTTTAAASPKPGVRVIGQVIQVPLRDGTNAIVAKLTGETGALDAIVIARGTVYGSKDGVAAVLRCGSESDAKAIADEIRGRF
jgi:hypothetical protein